MVVGRIFVSSSTFALSGKEENDLALNNLAKQLAALRRKLGMRDESTGKPMIKST